MILIKYFNFSAAHKLINYKGQCANLHGHTYKLQVSVSGKIKDSGVIIDFGKLKSIVNDHVLKKLDHSYLNDIISQPTAENIVRWIFNNLDGVLEKDKIVLEKIILWETPTSAALYTRKDIEN